MQRKRRNINFGYFSGSSGKSKFKDSITNTTLHSIPTVRMRRSNKKSDVCASSPDCGLSDISHFANVVRWTSPHCRSGERRNRTRSSREMTPYGEMQRYPEHIHSSASQVVMTPLSRLASYLSFSQNLKFPLYIICTLLLSFVVSGMMNGFECYAAVNPTASLSVSNPTLSTTVAPGDTAYLSSNVTYSASDIDSYTLQVSYANGYNSLKLDGGSTTLSGAGGKVGSSLTNNSWGFAWTNNTTNNTSTNAGLTYYTVPTYGTNGSGLSTGRLEAASNLNLAGNTTLSSTTKRIVFAAKFAENNTNSGHYKTGVQLSMVATPRQANKLSEITTMQEMTPRVCEKTPLISGQKYSAEYTLKDTRDGKTYTVRKLGDGRCWMTSNLKLKLTTAGLSKDDTDLNQGADWNQSSPSTVVKPTNTLTSLNTTTGSRNFSSDQGYYAVESYIASSSNAGETGYYSWNAATAGTGGTANTTGNFVPANSQAPSSICPKGWTLPTGGGQSDVNTESTWSDYYKLFRNMGLTISNTNLKPGANEYTNWGSGDLNIVQNATDSNSKVIYNFKYTGYVYNGSLDGGTSGGYWWSSTANGASLAYLLYIGSSNVYPGTNSLNGRYNGFAVRCIARDS